MGRLSSYLAVTPQAHQKLTELGRCTDLAQLSDDNTLGRASAAELNVALESALREPPNPLMVHVVGGLALSGRSQAIESGASHAAAHFATVYAGAVMGRALDMQS